MTLTISRADYDQLWQGCNLVPQFPPDSSFAEVQTVVPERLGQGYIQHMRWRGIYLMLFNYRFHEDVYVLEKARENTLLVGEIGFNLFGNRHGKCTGESFIEWGSCDEPDEWISITHANDPILKVDIHIESHATLNQLISDALEELPAEIRQYIENDNGNWQSEISVITPAMRSTVEQILHCPFQGNVKQIYLESKCLELIALKLDQLKDVDKRTGLFCPLKPDDIDRIHLARQILTSNLESPPSLMELARQVSLNDYKLKVGFRQVFGTTVFGYLHQRRMEKAQQLLVEQRMNVKEIAQTVGYANQSRFAAAFRKQFGVNPKSYLLSRKSG